MPSGRAVVIGASVAGLCTARVLQESFAEVIIVDRDVLPAGPQPRRGAPQGWHAHGLLARGREALEELFDALTGELTAAGALLGDIQCDLRWWLDGRPMAAGRSGLTGLAVSRPLLEHTIRRRVAALSGVRIIDDCEVVDLLATEDRSRVIGVRTIRCGTRARIDGVDLVVDAAGRATRSAEWLPGLGYPAAAEDGVDVQLTYVSRHYRRTGRELDGRLGTASAAYPGCPYGGFVLAQEGDRFVVSMSGWFGAVPPTDDEGMAAWAERLPAADIAAIVRTAEPLDEPIRGRYPREIRRRYERVDVFPAGYLVVGDAICSFNPFYGQGMTVVALEALLLRRLLADGLDGLAPRFFAGAADLVETPWSIATGNDFRFPEAKGDRRFRDTELDRYAEQLRARLAGDPVLATAFMRVTNLVDPPSRLLAPDVVSRVIGAPRVEESTAG
jgi:2-polyprenyl-6-methoxyphenol hydroxylase-like FAD-dependent oxidoreductase